MKRLGRVVSCLALLVFCGASDDCNHPDSDEVKTTQQERILMEGAQSVGMPNIKNFRELKLYKDILELRDQSNFSTYTYYLNEMNGKLVFFCASVGYPIPYATQFTSPQKIAHPYSSGYIVVPQADPNGLFSPASADGTWVMCKDPKGGDVKPVYVEPKIITSPFPLL